MVQQAMAPPPAEPPQVDPMQQQAQQIELAGMEADVEQKRAMTVKTYSDVQNNRANTAAKIMQAEMARARPREISEYAQR
jgi:hypothetical protein